jgi:hypothetical protein
VLRATGIRIEELTELSHHSLAQYRLPTTGEIVPLLQITPSKSDAERLLVVSPELAEVLSAIISRIRGTNGAVPLVAAYDHHERVWLPPLPLLFQRRVGSEQRALSASAIRTADDAIAGSGLTEPATGQPLRFTPHVSEDLFITDAVLNGLPPHIAQVIAGHRDINVTIHKAAHPDKPSKPTWRSGPPINVPLRNNAPLTRNGCSLRASNAAKSRSAPAAHSRQRLRTRRCVRCPLLWPDPTQRQRLLEIRDNLTARIAEAEREGWLGEVEGLQVSLAGAEDKLAQIDRRNRQVTSTELGIPTVTIDS